MIDKKNLIFNNLINKKAANLKYAEEVGDFKDLKNILTLSKEKIIQEVKDSGLRGRGGAGFPTGVKWSFMPQNSSIPSYLVINADESEPGTCKDRDIITYEPYKIIEGAIIGSYALNVNTCYIYIRGEFHKEYEILKNAIDECYNRKYLGKNILNSKNNIDIILHRGAGAYICGEETALLSSLEGDKGLPRLKPPFPANKGLYGCPTTINNIESIAVIPTILKRGAKWFNSLGTTNSCGTKIFSISGHVNNPCNVEEELGIPLKYLIEKYAGGVRGGWENLKAVIPGGSSVPLMPKKLCDDALMDFDSLKSLGTSLGTGAIIVMDNSTDIIQAIGLLSKFYMHESCGQCTPCREGTGWMWRIMNRLVDGNASISDIDNLLEISYQVEGNTICALGDAAAWPIQGLIKHFRSELENRILNFKSRSLNKYQ